MKKFIYCLLLFLLVLGCGPKPVATPVPAAPTVKVPTAAPTVAAPATKAPSMPVAPTAPPREATPKPAAPELKESVADFYKGKTIKIISTDPGGGTDMAARLTAPYVKKYTGANVAVLNKMGGGGVEAINYVYNAAKPDGLSIGFMDCPTMILNDFFEAPGAKYKFDEFAILGSVAPSYPYIMAIKPDGTYKSIDDLKAAKGLLLGGATVRGALAISSFIAGYTLGLDFKLITGFGGTAPLALAVAKGEVHACALNVKNIRMYGPMGYVKPLVAIDLERAVDMPEVPAMSEVTNLTEESKQLISTWTGVTKTGTVVFAPPGLSKDKEEFLWGVFEKIINSDDFRKDFEFATNFWAPGVTGKEASDLIKGMRKSEGVYKNLISTIEKYLG